MSRKNPKPLRDSKIEFQLSQLLCSSEEDLDDEAVDSFATSSYNVDLDKRLDEVQGISVEELHSLLVGELDLSLIQDETFLNSPVQRISKPIFKAVELIERKQKDGSKKKIYCNFRLKNIQSSWVVLIISITRASYPLGQKSRKNWHRLFWFLLEAAVINSYIVYMTSHSERRNTHKEFQLRLGRGLINNFSSRKILAPVFKHKKGGTISVPEEIRKSDVGSHMPELTKFRRCRMCSTREKEQRNNYMCKVCKVSLCAAPCFEMFRK